MKTAIEWIVMLVVVITIWFVASCGNDASRSNSVNDQPKVSQPPNGEADIPSPEPTRNDGPDAAYEMPLLDERYEEDGQLYVKFHNLSSVSEPGFCYGYKCNVTLTWDGPY